MEYIYTYIYISVYIVFVYITEHLKRPLDLTNLYLSSNNIL